MSSPISTIGVIGLAVMGQNLALNIASNGFNISVWNRSHDKTEHTVKRALDEHCSGKLTGYEKLEDFVQSLEQPRAIIFLVQAGAPVDAVISSLRPLLAPNDIIIDGGNEWYTNTQRRAAALAEFNINYVGMGVSGGEEGARFGPSLMPGGPKAAYDRLEPILTKIAAKADGEPCVTYIGEGGSGNYVKMIHNGIEYGDMQLIAEAYDILKTIGNLTNDELAAAFEQFNQGELKSFLIEITAKIFRYRGENGEAVVDAILDKTGSKGTGKWTVQEAADKAVPAATIASALDARYLSALLDQRKAASKILGGPGPFTSPVSKAKLIEEVGHALYAAKICSYTQGMNLIRAAGEANSWNLNLGAIARIWKGGCIIRAVFLDRITAAYTRDPKLASLMIDADFAKEMNDRQSSLRKVVKYSIDAGFAAPAFMSSLGYYDSYRRERLPANLTQAQRDFFGAHTYERTDKPGWFHTEWSKAAQ